MDNETLQAIRQMFIEEREHTSRIIDEKLEVALKPVNAGLDELKQRTRKIENKLEHEVASKIQSVYEGYLLNTEKLDQIQASVDDMAPTVTALDVLHQMQKSTKV